MNIKWRLELTFVYAKVLLKYICTVQYAQEHNILYNSNVISKQENMNRNAELHGVFACQTQVGVVFSLGSDPKTAKVVQLPYNEKINPVRYNIWI